MAYGALTGDLYSMSRGTTPSNGNTLNTLRMPKRQDDKEKETTKPSVGPTPSSFLHEPFERETPGQAGSIGTDASDDSKPLQSQAEGPSQRSIEDSLSMLDQQYRLMFGNRYSLTDNEKEVFQHLVRASEDPYDTASRFMTSLSLSKMSGAPVATVYQNLDEISQYYLGYDYQADDTSLWQKITNGFYAVDMYKRMYDYEMACAWHGADSEEAKAIEAEIFQMQEKLGGLENYVPKNKLDKALSSILGNFGYMAEGAEKASIFSMGIRATSYIASALMPYAAPAIIAGGETAAQAAAVVGTFSTYSRMAEASRFWENAHAVDDEGNPVEHNVTANILTSWAEGIFVGGAEAFMDGLTSRMLGATVAPQFKGYGLSDFVTDLLENPGKSTAANRFSRAMVDYFTGVGDEALLEEGSEAVVGYLTDFTYKKLAGAKVDFSVKDMMGEYVDAALEGGLVALAYGAFGIPGSMHKYNDVTLALQREAIRNDSHEMYMESIASLKPEGLDMADLNDAAEKVWQSTKLMQAQARIYNQVNEEIAQDEIYSTINPATGEEEGIVPDGSVYRDPETSSIHTETREENGRTFVYAGDPESHAVYGYAELSSDGDTLTVENVKVRPGYEGIREELVRKAISEERTGESSIEWNPRTEGLKNVREMLVQNNPKGREAGLDYGADFSPSQDHDIQTIATNIRTAMPNLSREESVVAARLYSIADADGSLTRLNEGQPVRSSDTLPARYRGAADGAKAIIYAGQNADFSTFYHELFHVNAVQRPAEARGLSRAISSSMQDDVSKANLRKFIEESREIWGKGFDADEVMMRLERIAPDSDASSWTREQFEDLARLAEAYAVADNSKRTTLPEAIRTILRKIADYMRRIYQTVTHTVPLPKEITDAYDKLMTGESGEARTQSEVQGIQHQPKDVIRMPIKENTYEAAIELATKAHPQFVNDVEDIRQLVGADESDVSIRPTLKSRKRSDEKVIGDYGGDYSRNLDYDGAMIKFDSLKDAEKAWKKVKKAYDPRIANEKHLITPMGYEDYKINIRMDNGFIAEIQFLDRDYFFIKEKIGHDLYEISRTITEFKKHGVEGFNALQEAIDAWSAQEYGLAKIYTSDRTAYESSEARRNAVSSSIRQALSSALSRYQVSSESVSALSTISLPSSEGISLDTGEIVVASILNGISLISTYLKDSGIMPSTQSIDSQRDGGNLVYQSAWHGSPHSFDRFSTDHIGEGAGSQSFGWGIYITGDRKIAEGYAELGISEEDKASDIEYFQKTLDAARSRFEDAQQRLEADPQNQLLRQEYNNALRQLNDEEEDMQNLLDSPAEGRNLYTVDIPDEGYIKWDDEVPEPLARRIAIALDADEYDMDDILRYYRTSGSEMYSYLSKQLDGDKNASLFLRNLGVVGIDYLAGTRMGLPAGAKAGSRNYVIFSGDDITIQDHLLYQDEHPVDYSGLTEDETRKKKETVSADQRYYDGDETALDDLADDFIDDAEAIQEAADAEYFSKMYSDYEAAFNERTADVASSMADENIPEYDPDGVNVKSDGTEAEGMADYEDDVNDSVIPSKLDDDDFWDVEEDGSAGAAKASPESSLSDADIEAIIGSGDILASSGVIDGRDTDISWKEFVRRNKPDIAFDGTDAQKDDILISAIQDDATLSRYIGIMGEALFLNTRYLNDSVPFIDQAQRERLKDRVYDILTSRVIRNAAGQLARGEGPLSPQRLASVRREISGDARIYRNALSMLLNDDSMRPENLVGERRGLDIPSRDVLDAMPIAELRRLAKTARDEDILSRVERGSLKVRGDVDEARADELNEALKSLADQVKEQRSRIRDLESTNDALQTSLDSLSGDIDARDKAIDYAIDKMRGAEAILGKDASKLTDTELEAYSYTDRMREIRRQLSLLSPSSYQEIENRRAKGKRGSTRDNAIIASRNEFITDVLMTFPDILDSDYARKTLTGNMERTSDTGFRAIRKIFDAKMDDLRSEWKDEAVSYIQGLAADVRSQASKVSKGVSESLDRIARLEKELDKAKEGRADARKEARAERGRLARTKSALDSERKYNAELEKAMAAQSRKARKDYERLWRDWIDDEDARFREDERRSAAEREAAYKKLWADWIDKQDRKYRKDERNAARKKRSDYVAWWNDQLQKQRQELQLAWTKAREERRADDRVKRTRETYERRIDELRKDIRRKRNEERFVRMVNDEKAKYARAIMRPVNLSTTDYDTSAEAIMAIQAIVDPHFRREWIYDLRTNPEGEAGGDTMTIDEAKRYLGSLSDYDRSDVLATLSPDLVARLTERTRPLNDFSMYELRDLAEQVNLLRKRGREALAAKKEAERMTSNAVVRSVIMAVRDRADKRGDALPGSIERMARARSLRSTVTEGLYATWRPDELSQLLDGGFGVHGAARRVLVDEKRYHQNRENAAIDARKDPINAMLTKETAKRFFDKHTVDLGDIRMTLTNDQLAYIYLSQFNDETRDAVAYGNMVLEREKGTVTNKLVLEDGKASLQFLVADNGSIADDAVLKETGDRRYKIAVEYAENALEDAGLMPVVKAIEADFNNPRNRERLQRAAIDYFNKPMELVKYYLPIFRTDVKGNDFDNVTAGALFNLNTGEIQGSPEKGFTIPRIKNISPRHQRGVNLSLLSVWDESVRNQEHLIEFSGYVKKLYSIFNNRELNAMVNQAYSPGLMHEIQSYIKLIANPLALKDTGDKAVNKLLRTGRGRLTTAYLAWKLSGIVMQATTSPWPFLREINPVRLASAYMQLATGRTKVLDDIWSKSTMMKHRSMDMILQEAMDRQRNVTESAQMSRLRELEQKGMNGLEWVDRIAVAGGWLAKYQEQLEAGQRAGLDTATAEAAAIKAADDLVLAVQPSGDPTELPSLFRTRNEGLKALLQFQSSLSVIWNNMTADIIGYKRTRQYGKILAGSIAYALAGIALGLAAEGFDDDDDEKDMARKLAYWALTQPIESIPLVGSTISSALQKAITGSADYYGTGFSLWPPVEKLSRGLQKLLSKDPEGLWSIAEGAALFTGLPVSGFKQAMKAVTGEPEAFLGR